MFSVPHLKDDRGNWLEISIAGWLSLVVFEILDIGHNEASMQGGQLYPV